MMVRYRVVGMELGVPTNGYKEIMRTDSKIKAQEVHECLCNLIFIEDLSLHMPPIDGWFMVREYLISIYDTYGLVNLSGYDDFNIEVIHE